MKIRNYIAVLLASKFVIWPARVFCVLAVCLIFWKSLTPVSFQNSFNHMDKFLHFGGYFVVCGLALLSQFSSRAVLSVCAVILMGVGIEGLQGFMSLGRSISFWDAVANSVGALLAFGLWSLIQTRPVASSA